MTIYIFIITFLVGVWAANDITSHKYISNKPMIYNGSIGIYGGKAVDIDKHPYLVAVTLKGTFITAGSIIADSWVLLAADRVYNEDPAELEVIAGSQDRKTGKKYAVVQVVTHPEYKYFDYDYGLLKIKGIFDWSSKIQKVALASKPPKVGAEVVIAGWGDKKSDASLQEGTMSVISLKQCKAAYTGFAITLTSRMVCIYNKGKTTPCDDDWSDPVTRGSELNSMFIAIAHRGECSDYALPAVCANIYPALSWIKSVISHNSTVQIID